ncbi:MAG TPA: Scr1 family TA system antitoxin-like transcriptional regulator [Actinophytocola sp.]|jgi:hypothetical protein|uniref:Scr1 family TA system antitoxin-like transcriptional regulator n=1 Tax=Actinophytocola sp. TaxID=1872138 RepID=UPI002E0100CC|nr:Scr1 family TA system antitoxin-like transcriptional regulator [Actinophytocola sp.]
MAGQFRHLAGMSQWSNVDVRVMPFGSGWHPGLEGPFVLIEPRQATAAVQLESRRSLLLLHEEADVVSNMALGEDDSAKLIAE